MNQSQENWADVQLSLSTAKPSLGGTPPKLNTLRVDYYAPPRHYVCSAGFAEDCSPMEYAMSGDMVLKNASMFSKKSRSLTFRGRKALESKAESIEEADESRNTLNVLETKTEASMSSASFAIPRRATIDADVCPQ